jgi:steroid delta-isomerase-like uncharacterized protein
MSTEQNKAVVRQLIEEVINQNNLSLGEEIIAVDIIEHEELPPGIPTGIEGTKIMFTMLHNAFPDFKATIHELIAEEDKVAVFMTWSGTQQGDWMGLPPSGKPMSVHVMGIFRVADGKLVEHWGLMDSMKMMQQLGAMPTPE